MYKKILSGILTLVVGALCLGTLTSAKEAAPATIKLADGKKVPIVTVLQLNADPKAHKGLIAIDGQVGEVFADKGRFMLAAYGEGVCTDENCEGCAADQQLPIRYDKAKITGKVPAKDQKVYVVAIVTPTETGGFTVELKEIRSGDKTILSVKS
jgi:hypothetical protein